MGSYNSCVRALVPFEVETLGGIRGGQDMHDDFAYEGNVIESSAWVLGFNYTRGGASALATEYRWHCLCCLLLCGDLLVGCGVKGG